METLSGEKVPASPSFSRRKSLTPAPSVAPTDVGGMSAATAKSHQQCAADVDTAAKACKERLFGYVLEPAQELLDDDQWDELVTGVNEAVGKLSCAASDSMRELWDSALQTARSQLKKQELAFALKLERSRTASQVSLQNQAAEMEASHHRQLEAKVATIGGESDTALNEAHKRVEELTRKLDGETVKSKKLSELLSTTERLHKSSESRCARLEADLAKLEEERCAADDERSAAAQKHAEEVQRQRETIDSLKLELEASQAESAKLAERFHDETAQLVEKHAEEVEQMQFATAQLTKDNRRLAEQLKDAIAQYESAMERLESAKRLAAGSSGELIETIDKLTAERDAMLRERDSLQLALVEAEAEVRRPLPGTLPRPLPQPHPQPHPQPLTRPLDQALTRALGQPRPPPLARPRPQLRAKLAGPPAALDGRQLTSADVRARHYCCAGGAGRGDARRGDEAHDRGTHD